MKVQVSWLLRLANCAEEYLGIDEGTDEERAVRKIIEMFYSLLEKYQLLPKK